MPSGRRDVAREIGILRAFLKKQLIEERPRVAEQPAEWGGRQPRSALPGVDASRRRWRRPRVDSPASRYLADLPTVFQDPMFPFLGRYLRIFEHIWEPFEWRQDHIEL